MALKKISTSQVELGMFIHGFQGNWLSHPFWKARFVLSDEDKLETLRSSKLDAIIIDTDRGIDLPANEDRAAATVVSAPRPNGTMQSRQFESRTMPRPAPVIARPTGGDSAAFRSGPVPMAREFGKARQTAGKARKVISKVFLEARLGKAPRVAEVTPVVEDIYASIQRNPYAFSGLMRCKAESETIYQHMLSVSALMISLARQMKLSPNDTRNAGMAGLLLDVGVSRLYVNIDPHAGGISAIPSDVWHRHPYIGKDLLEAAGEVPEDVLNAVMRHHERLDGTGFPQNLSGSQVDLLSRMAAVCDTYDHIVSGMLNGHAADPANAMQELIEMRDVFDGEVLDRFVEALGVYPVGSFVLLRSERIAMVIDQNPEEPAAPTVRTFYSLANRKRIVPKTIVLSNCFGEDAIIGVESLDGLGLPPVEELREQILTGKSAQD
ncbi:HD-GYP domain-containing protein [Novosphingobium sp. PY1]|uniref:HD-GYP domain-containing protein n=1 Tax=Novosphingobium sp. PY1 TaxID=1882221 RepID=UPI001F5D8208|nr:HD-GYP domain-containing protein [Novosphingobium sp. PY1]